MNTSIPPTRKPGAKQLYKLLGGDPKADNVLSGIIDQLDLDATARLAGLVRNAVTEARHESTSVGESYGVGVKNGLRLAVSRIVTIMAPGELGDGLWPPPTEAIGPCRRGAPLCWLSRIEPLWFAAW